MENISLFYKKTISVTTALKAVPSGTVALFAPQKGRNGVSGLSEEVISQHDLLQLPNPAKFSANGKRLQDLKEYFEKIFGKNYLLTRLIDYGTAFHNGDLPQEIREIIEDSLRDGSLPLIICTNTLAEGVNLPIKTLVIHSTNRYYDPNRNLWIPMDIRDLKNIVGRAGRAGKETTGLVISANPSDFRLITKVIKDIGNENVTGYLLRIVKAIESHVKKERLVLSNQLLEEQEEWFKELIDSIDISITSLLAEEINIEQLDSLVNSLVEKTFAFQQANDADRKILKDLFNLRCKVLKGYIEINEFKAIKGSGASIRLYEAFTKSVDLDDELWTMTNDPLSENWLAFIKSFIFNLPQIKTKIEKFNKDNKMTLSVDKIIEIITYWISGKVYKGIAKHSEIEVDIILKLFASLIGFDIQNVVSNIVRIADSKLLKKDLHLSETIFNWSQYLLFGLNSRLQLDLVDLGFTNRMGIIALSEIIQDVELKYDEIKKLKKYVVNNSNYLSEELSELIPQIAYEKIKENLDYLSRKNIY